MRKKVAAENSRFMSVDEACDYAYLSKSTAYKLIHQGKILAKRLGSRKTLVDRQSLEKFLDSLPKVTR